LSEKKIRVLWHLETLMLLGVLVVDKSGRNNLVHLWDASVGAKEGLSVLMLAS